MAIIKPVVSVIMPACNHRSSIGEAVESVLSQSLESLELIIVDCASAEGAEDVLPEFKESRVKLIPGPKCEGKVVRALNHGVGVAQAEYLAILLPGDRYKAQRLARLLELAQSQTLDLVCCDLQPMLSEGEEMVSALLCENAIVSASNLFFRRELFDHLGGFRGYRFIYDWDFALRAAFLTDGRIGYLGERLLDYDAREGSPLAGLGRRVQYDSEVLRMYSTVLAEQQPQWEQAFQRQLQCALDIRRCLSREAVVLNEALAHCQAQLSEQATLAAQKMEHEQQLGEAVSGLRKELQRVHQSYSDAIEASTLEGEGLRQQEQIEMSRQQEELALIYQSLSWRLTKPVRGLGRLLRAAKVRGFDSLTGFWRLLPVRPDHRFRVKSYLFSRYPRLFQATQSFAAWQAERAIAPRPWETGDRFWVEVSSESELVGKGRIQAVGAGTPDVSVVIPVYNKLDYTLRCLDSIAAHMPKAAIEVIVVDDGSSDETEPRLSDRTDLHYLRNAKNLGFIGSCNRGAKEARGRFLFFLNNDTAVLEGWLDELVATFTRIQEAGLVGSKLIYPDGRLQEAGGIVWVDASGWNWGKFKDRMAPAYNFMRDVDYCSGAAIMVPRALFLEMGGFSERYSPAYYEDTDLAFRLRAGGYRVLYQPMSWVVHYEGVTSGTDTSKGVKSYQERNREVFFERWKTVLIKHGTADSQPLSLAADRRPRGRLLLIDHCTPTPDQDSGSVDLVNYLRLLDELGYRVTFIPDSDRLHFGRYTDALQARGVECLYHPFLKSVTDVLTRRGAEFDAVMLMRGPLAYRYIDEVRKRCPHAKIIFNTVDLHFLREQRRATLETGDPDSQAARDAKREELYVASRADATIVISPVEKAILESEVPEAQVGVIPLIREVSGRDADFSSREGLLFVGGFQHPPNVDAVHWLCREIWPALRSRLPSVRLTIVGSKLTPEVAALADFDIDVLGYVEDLTPLLAGARLSLAPLRYGAGQKGKVIGSLSHGLPCIATSVAAEGLGLGAEDGVLIGDTVDEFAEATALAYTDAGFWDRLSRNGLGAVEREFSLDANRLRLRQLLSSLHLPA